MAGSGFVNYNPSFEQAQLAEIGKVVSALNMKFAAVGEKWHDVNSAKFESSIIQGINAAWGGYQAAATNYLSDVRASLEELDALDRELEHEGFMI